MTLYEAIEKRRSVRSFEKRTVERPVLERIEAYGRDVAGMFPDLEWKMELVPREDSLLRVVGPFKVRAPYYMIFWAAGEETEARQVGIAAEHIVLYMTAHGLGTCYQGAVRCTGAPEGMHQIIAVAFGYAAQDLYRDPAQAKRKPDKEVFFLKEDISENMRTILRAVRLAPSSMNMQSTRFVVYRDRIHLFVPRRKNAAARRYEHFQAGITEAHIMLAAEELWLDGSFTQNTSMADLELKNSEYAESFLLSQQ
ncbi:MAG: nitroreductase family protein [Lachnospiraceae bacterium]|nr:nitroreductase family protein [Lachnospiraceae bacterium]